MHDPSCKRPNTGRCFCVKNFRFHMSYGLNLGWGETYRGLYRALGGLIKGYITNLIQGSYGVRRENRAAGFANSFFSRWQVVDT